MRLDRRFAVAAHLACALVLLGCLALAGCGTGLYSPASELRDRQGREHFEKGDYAGALECFDSAIQANPRNAGAYNDRAITKRATGDFAGAMADLDMGLALDPNGSAALYLNRGQTKAPGVLHGMAGADLAGNDVGGSLADLARAVSLDPHGFVGSEAHKYRTLIFIVQGDWPAAIAEIQSWLLATPRNPDGTAWRGVLCLLQLRDAEAQTNLQKYYKTIKDPAVRATAEAEMERIRQRRHGG
jgi:tetratricopeptide (TPR) repeat protein